MSHEDTMFGESEDITITKSPNPLLIHTVIKEVSDYLSSNELKACRLVCKQWDEELSKILRKATHIRLLTDKRLEEFLNASIINFTFCSNFYLGSDVTLKEEHGSLSRRLFDTYGPFIKSLYLNNCKWSKENLLAILYHHCPHLEEICLVGSGVEEGLFHQVPSDEEQQLQTLPTPVENIKCLRVNLICTRMIRNTKLMADLLKITPNVETISWIETYLDEIRYDRNFQLDLERAWCAKPHENGTTIRDTITDTAIHHKNIRLSKLSSMSNMRLNNESIQVLQGRQFPLKVLDISLTIDVEPDIVSNLLTSLSSTLVTLRLEFYPTHGSTNFFNFNFPKMSNIEHLFLQKFSSNFSFYKNFSSSKFPRLKSLTFCETDFKGMIENEVETFQRCIAAANSCQSRLMKYQNKSIRILQVTCDLSRFILSNKDISDLANFFPNLREVRLEHFDKIDKSIWEQSFKNLRYFGCPSDKGLGGLPSPKGENECSKCSCVKTKHLGLKR